MREGRGKEVNKSWKVGERDKEMGEGDEKEINKYRKETKGKRITEGTKERGDKKMKGRGENETSRLNQQTENK